MGRANRIAWLLSATLACHASPPPQPVGKPASLAERREALERADADPSGVTPEWVMLQVAELETIGGDATVPDTSRAEAYVLAAKAEGVLIEHFTTLFWNKAEPGRRVIDYLRRALALDRSNEAAAIAYTFALLGVRNSGFRGHAEDTMGVKTTPELEAIAPLLASHGDSLLAQSVLAAALEALRADAPLAPELEDLTLDLDRRIASLRARDPAQAKRVDAELERYAR